MCLPYSLSLNIVICSIICIAYIVFYPNKYGYPVQNIYHVYWYYIYLRNLVSGIFPPGQNAESQLKWLLDPLPVDSRVIVSVDEDRCPAAWK